MSILGTVLIGALLFRGALWVVDTPTFVDLTIVNPTAYDVYVDARSSGDPALVGLGRVRHGREAGFDGVLDQGDVWVFEFDYGGVDAGSLEVTREDLVDSDWRVEVPTAVATELEAAGIGLPPP